MGSLAFAPDGSLWAAAWPHDANAVVRFERRRAAPQVMLRFATNVNSLAFGVPGTQLDGLLFVSHDQAADGSAGTELTMVDLATLRQVAVATGGTRGNQLATTADGRVLLSQSYQVDVLNAIRPPHVAWTNPPPEALLALPLDSVSVTFDADMLADDAGNANSVLNPANYVFRGDAQGPIPITQRQLRRRPPHRRADLRRAGRRPLHIDGQQCRSQPPGRRAGAGVHDRLPRRHRFLDGRRRAASSTAGPTRPARRTGTTSRSPTTRATTC